MFVKQLWRLVFIVSVTGCVTQRTTSTSQSGRYSEDLSGWRPKVEADIDSVKSPMDSQLKKTNYVEPRYAVTKPLNTVLDSINAKHLDARYVDGYTIQIYSGLNREEALNAKKELTNALPDIDSQVQYNQPNFRVKAGKYYSHLEAQKDFTAVKRYFPSAILIPDRILIE